MKSSKKLAKKPTHFYVRLLSRHPSIADLRKAILVKGDKVVYRHGSTTLTNIGKEVNSVQSIRNSADKLLMKKCFDVAGISHAKWIELSKHGTKDFEVFLQSVEFPKNKLIIKHRFGSRGTGNYLVDSKEALDKFIVGKNLSNYIVEEFKKYSVEYRVHVTEDGYFYTCRKCLKSDTPKEERFQRHDDNSVWLLETNPAFQKPENWNEIVEDCVKALKGIGADILAFDIKCTSIKEKKTKNTKWIILESCSAPAMGKITLEKYKEIIPKIIKRKYNI